MSPIIRGPGRGTPAAPAAAPPVSTSATTRSPGPGAPFRGLVEANGEAIDWVVDHAGVRVHGTTQEIPIHVLEARERPALLPLPSSPFDLVEWKERLLEVRRARAGEQGPVVVYEDDDAQAVQKYVAQRERMGAGVVVVVRSLAPRAAPRA